jgi:hypothetical protein
MITLNVINNNDTGIGSFRQALLNIKNNENLSYESSISSMSSSEEIKCFRIIFSKAFHILLCDDLPQIDKDVEIYFYNSTIDGNDFFSFSNINSCNVIIHNVHFKNMMSYEDSSSIINVVDSSLTVNGQFIISNNDNHTVLKSVNSTILLNISTTLELGSNNDSYIFSLCNSSFVLSTKIIYVYGGDKFISSLNSTVNISNTIINNSHLSFIGKNTVSLSNMIFNNSKICLKCDRSLLNRNEFNKCSIVYRNGIHTMNDNILYTSIVDINKDNKTVESTINNINNVIAIVRITSITMDNSKIENYDCNVKIGNSNIMNGNVSVLNTGIMEVMNSTLGHNQCAIRNYNILSIINCTIARNIDGIEYYHKNHTSKTTIVNSIICMNKLNIFQLANCSPIKSDGYNVLQLHLQINNKDDLDSSVAINVNDNDILLNDIDKLNLYDYENNGGKTLTMKIDNNSCAYNTGNPKVNCGLYDQRNVGFERKKKINNVQYISIGAYQNQ